MSSQDVNGNDSAVEPSNDAADTRVKNELLEPRTFSGLAVPMRKPKKPIATVYDAVAGKYTIFKNWTPRPTNTFNDITLAPEDVLFQSSEAPTRYHENDIYFANEHLPNYGDGILPNSDLLNEVHNYASRFYEAVALRAEQRFDRARVAVDVQEKAGRTSGGLISARLLDECSMDETALIAFGILLEEASRQALGARGDLVFTEAAEDDESTEAEGSERGGGEKHAQQEHAKGGPVDAEDQESQHTEEERQHVQKKPRLKRRKLSGRRQALGSDE